MSTGSSIMLDFGDFVRSRSNSFRQSFNRSSRPTSRRASSSLSSTSSRPTSPVGMV
eukprot:14855.XXX_925538_925702_1 [CDS] Oithona nana genome sequencing.